MASVCSAQGQATERTWHVAGSLQQSRSTDPLSAVPLGSFLLSQLLLWIWLNDRDEPPLVCEVRPDLPGLAEVLHELCQRVPFGGVHVDVVPAQAEGCCRYTVLRAQRRTMRAAISCEVARYHSG